MMSPSFEYIRGPVRTTTPWFRPDGSRLNHWRDQLFKIPAIDKYNLWIVGGALEEWYTWDTDIIMKQTLGDFDCQEIERIMTEALKIGLENNQLIDLHFCLDPNPGIFSLTKSYGSLSLEDFMNLGLQHEVLQLAMEVTKNGVVSRDISADPTQLGEYLWKVKKIFPAQKHIERKKRGIVYKKDPVLVTRVLDFTKVINSGEKHV